VNALDDINTGELSGAYRESVAAALPDDVKPSEQWWRELASALVDYFVVVQEYAAERPPKRVRESMQKIGALIDPLGEELRANRRLPLSLAWSDATSELLTALAVVRELAAREAKRYDRMIAATSGRNDPHQKLLYDAVLDLWDRGLNQGLHYSKGGPLVRFFKAVVDPVLGKRTPGASRIGGIVREYKRRISEIVRERKRTRSNSKK
jgi:hypothetical protein